MPHERKDFSALDAINAAAQSLHSARQNGRRLRSQVDRLARHLSGDLRYALRDASPTDQQQIMRTYGVRFQRTATQRPAETSTPSTTNRSIQTTQAGIMGWQLQAEGATIAA